MFALIFPLNSKFFFAQHEGKYIAGALFFVCKDIVTFIAGGSYREKWNVYPNNALFWHAIEFYHNKGFKTLDLLGIDLERIGKFKKGWGGEIVSHHLCTKKSLLFRMARFFVTMGKND